LPATDYWVRVLAAQPRPKPVRRAAKDRAPASFPLLEFLVLQMLQHSEMYGLEIVQALSRHRLPGISQGPGVVYALLKNLASDGVLVSRRVAGTPKVYYRITVAGAARLEAVRQVWIDIEEAVQTVSVHS